MSGPTFGKPYDIDRAARRYVRDVMESNWVLRERDPDVFVDYEIEHRLLNEPTGRVAWIQMKGQENLRAGESTAAVTMETKHLRYYYNDARLPVFVVLVDVTSRRAFYLFMQEWLASRLSALETQQTLTVLVPLTNALENYPKFLTEFERAAGYMKDRFPGRPEVAVAEVEKNLQQLDPRFRVKVTADSSSRHIQIFSQTPANISLGLRGFTPEKGKELSHALDWGKPFAVQGIKLSAQGSKLFEEMCKAPRADLQWEPSMRLSCRLTITAKLKGKAARLVLHAGLTAGAKGISIESDSPYCPFIAELFLFWTPPGEQGLKAQLQLRMQAEKWIGHDILTAPLRAQVIPFVSLLVAGANVTLDATTDDGRFELSVPKAQKHFQLLKENEWWFSLIADAAKVAERYNLAPKIPSPESLNDENVAALVFAFDTLQSNSVRRSHLNMHLKEGAIHHDLAGLKKALDLNKELIGQFCGRFPCILEVFGEQRHIGYIEIEPTRCRLTPLIELPPGYVSAFKIERFPSGQMCSVVHKFESDTDEARTDGQFSFELDKSDDGRE